MLLPFSTSRLLTDKFTSWSEYNGTLIWYGCFYEGLYLQDNKAYVLQNRLTYHIQKEGSSVRENQLEQTAVRMSALLLIFHNIMMYFDRIILKNMFQKTFVCGSYFPRICFWRITLNVNPYIFVSRRKLKNSRKFPLEIYIFSFSTNGRSQHA